MDGGWNEYGLLDHAGRTLRGVMEKKESIRRLQMAYDYMMAGDFEVDTFNMNDWGSADVDEPTGDPCNTVACMAGTLSLAPQMQELGFRAEWVWGNDELILEAVDKTSADPNFVGMAEKAFGITNRQALELFTPLQSDFEGLTGKRPQKNPRVAAQRIKRLILAKKLKFWQS